eukprot:scaffold69_cov248-Pinguiococcus_pyrenoidosus.AAC.76
MRARAFWLLLFARVARSANWAQVSGELLQGRSIPYIPSAGEDTPSDRPHWSKRFGLSALAVPNVTNPATRLKEDRLYVLGGDSYSEKSADEAGRFGEAQLPHKPFRGGYLNDVWYATIPQPSQWLVRERVSEPKTDAGDYRPSVSARIEWKKVSDGRLPPNRVTYDEWIQCQAPFRASLPDPSICDDSTEAPGSYVIDNMWSPRRNHRALFFKGAIFVMGGRARAHRDLSAFRAVGGLLEPSEAGKGFYARVKAMPATDRNGSAIDARMNSGWREPSVLKNDVWASYDGGLTWEMVSPGCIDPQSKCGLETCERVLVCESWFCESQFCESQFCDPSLPRVADACLVSLPTHVQASWCSEAT